MKMYEGKPGNAVLRSGFKAFRRSGDQSSACGTVEIHSPEYTRLLKQTLAT